MAVYISFIIQTKNTPKKHPHCLYNNKNGEKYVARLQKLSPWVQKENAKHVSTGICTAAAFYLGYIIST